MKNSSSKAIIIFMVSVIFSFSGMYEYFVYKSITQNHLISTENSRTMVDRIAHLTDERLEEKNLTNKREMQDKNILRFLSSSYMQLKPEKQFCQTSGIGAENLKAIIHRMDGLCHIFCDLVVIAGHDNPIIEKIMSGNATAEQIRMMNDLSKKQHVFDLLTFTERLLLVVFKIFPQPFVRISEQSQFLIINNDDSRSINEIILQKVFDRILVNQYIQLSLMQLNLSNLVLPFRFCHATLLFKTIHNTKIYYNFFEPNYGFFQSENTKDIAKVINTTILNNTLFQNYTVLGVTDLKILLKRDPISSELMKKFDDVLNSK